MLPTSPRRQTGPRVPRRCGTDNGRLYGSYGIAERRPGHPKAAKPVLTLEASAQLRDRLLAELNNLGSADDAATWAHAMHHLRGKESSERSDLAS
jgi:hypothetical protein